MIKKIVIAVIIFPLMVAVGTLMFIYWGIFTPYDNQAEEVIFTVSRGEGMAVVAENLEKEGIIRSSNFFIIYGRVSDKGKMLKPGNYRLSGKMSVADIMDLIVKGGEDRLVVIEGWNIRDISKFLREADYIEDSEEFFLVVGFPSTYKEGELSPPTPPDYDFKEDFPFLEEMPEGLPLEGFLFPDTYFISPGTPVVDIVYSMLSNFNQKVVETLPEKERGELSLFEIIVRASLIEKEVFLYEDKRLVAGIIENRIDRGMRLQIDATISYLTGRRSVQIPVTETRIPSPYNTYANHGLPVGPICSPGIESIRAVLDPKESDYLYYLSKPDGETVFSTSYTEHIRAKNKYLR